MPRQSNGVYQQPANTAAIPGATISSSAFNTLETDIGNEITNSLDRNGRSAMQAALPMGGQRITGMADPAATTDAATKAYVDAATGSFFSTGDVKLTLKTAADTGWILFDDGTFGSAGSGSSSRANNDTQALFNLFFNGLSDAAAPLLTSGGGATTRAAQTNAATAWAANCRMSLPKSLGRALAVAGAGSGLTARALGTNLGEENHLLTTPEVPSHQHDVYLKDIGHGHDLINGTNILNAAAAGSTWPGGSGGGTRTTTVVNNTTGITIGSVNGTANDNKTAAAGGGTAHNNMQPTVFLNCMVKL